MRFHFDSYVLTALIPIPVPDHGNPGRLIIHPNSRGIRRTYLRNLVNKVLVDNRLSQTLFNAAYRRGSKRVIRLSLKPGNLYFFWGYRSLHTNERATPMRSAPLHSCTTPTRMQIAGSSKNCDGAERLTGQRRLNPRSPSAVHGSVRHRGTGSRRSRS
jgi:hypothetical protein